jgi:hypothetical protein
MGVIVAGIVAIMFNPEWLQRPLNLAGADLKGKSLVRMNLENINANLAEFQGADLQGTVLEGAFLQRTSLQGARSLTVEQLCTVHTLHEALLDSYLMEQIQQQCPQRLEEPRE